MNSLATGDWLTRQRILRIATIALVVWALLIAYLFATASGTLDATGRPLGADFSQVWTAGRMVLDGHAAQVWNWDAHRAVQRAAHGPALSEWYGWHYPPPFLLIATALAAMPYLVALLLWQLATLLPFAWMMRRYTGQPEAFLLVLSAPVTLICLLHGHNGFLTALLLGGGLILLERRPFVAGLLLGCLAYKPQFALVIPLVLLVGGHGRAILGATVSSLGLVALTYAIWGWPVWQAFIDSLPLTRAVVIEQGQTGWHKIMSPFAAIRMWGGTIPFAYLAQGVATFCAIVAGCWLSWRGRPELRNAAVTAAVLIATPYVLDYDFVVLLAGIAFLWRDALAHGWGRWEKTALALVWIAPLLARNVAEWTCLPIGLVSAVMVLVIAVRRQLRALPSRH